MRDQHRSKQDLINENTDLRKQVADLKQAALERRRVEDGLRNERELLRALLNQAPHALCLLTSAGVPLVANQPFVELLGYSSPGEFVRLAGDLGLLLDHTSPPEPGPGSRMRDLTFRRFDGAGLVAPTIASPVPGTGYLAITVLADPQLT